MIEYFRFFLSVVVMERHIAQSGPISIGWQSVFAFYTLSGFLMTRVLNERYGFSARGFSAFALNRLLRLWPAYLIVAALSLPVAAPVLYGNFRAPGSAMEWLANLAVLGLAGFDYAHLVRLPMLVPNAWSLSIEVFCYLLLGAYFARTPARLTALAALGAVGLFISTVTCAASDTTISYGPYCFQNRYNVLQAGFIPFAVGGLLYFHLDRVTSFLRGKLLWLATVFAGCQWLFVQIPSLQFIIAPFAGCALAAAVVARNEDGVPMFSGARFVGRASYYFFIAHWAVATLLFSTGLFSGPGASLFFATLAGSLLLSGGLYPVEMAVERVRRKISAAAAMRVAARRPGAPELLAVGSDVR